LKFAKEGYLPAAVPAVAGVAAGLLLGWAVGAALLVFALLVLLFFRDPERRPPDAAGVIVAPADGRVVSVVTDGPPHRLDPESCQRVSIFMSPLNVHVNRMPAAGRVDGIEYNEGRFRAAYSEDAATVNESNALRLRTPEGWSMVVVQIAGWLARRIVCHVSEGDELGRGDRFGLIMFGSRVDVYLPAAVKITVVEGQRVQAGSTAIGEVTQP
jgi:phosphatidylserine decarboxylase